MSVEEDAKPAAAAVRFSDRNDGVDDNQDEDVMKNEEECSEKEASTRNDSIRTASTNSTLFSTSSLPSLEGIDLVAATRTSFSELPDVEDGDVGNEPSTVVTAGTGEDFDHPPPPPHEYPPVLLPLAASPRLPMVAYGSHVTTSPQEDNLALKRPPTALEDSTAALPMEHPPKRARPAGTTAIYTNTSHLFNPESSVLMLGPPNSGDTTPSGSTTTDPTVAAASVEIPLQYHSKHDEKWFHMLQQLQQYQKKEGNTLVPQCYFENPRLGRWVHYQRVEYWKLQQARKAKITAGRIRTLESIGFEWDPQTVQWQAMYAKLCGFCNAHGHCKVPKGWPNDVELANWVRNQRLEFANQQKGKRSRMTAQRVELLNKVGFTWSSSLSPRRNSDSTNTTKETVTHSDPTESSIDPLPLDDSRE